MQQDAAWHGFKCLNSVLKQGGVIQDKHIILFAYDKYPDTLNSTYKLSVELQTT